MDKIVPKLNVISKESFFRKRAKVQKKISTSIFPMVFQNSLLKAKTENKLVLVDFGADWCVPCQIFEDYTIKLPNVKSYLDENYVVQHIDIESFDGIALKNYYKIKLLPTILIMDGNKNILNRFEEGLSSEKLLSVLAASQDEASITERPNLHY